MVVVAYTMTPLQYSTRNITELKCTYMLVSQKVSGNIYLSVFVVLVTLLYVHTETRDLVDYMR